MLIGIDFDNTIAGYDDLFLKIGTDLGWLPPGCPQSKKEIRDQVRLLPNGNDKWTEMQALAYGPHMPEAKIFDGVADFMKRCLSQGLLVCIVSHKTQFASARPDGVDLRQASLAWMEAQGFFRPDGIGLSPNQIYFESTRQNKCQRIAQLGCDVFIDDLEEVFEDPAFPATTRQILFHDISSPPSHGSFEAKSSWKDIADAIFNP